MFYYTYSTFLYQIHYYLLKVEMADSYAVSVASVSLTKDDLDPSKILNGNPEVFSAVMSTSYNGHVVRGIWKCTEGTVTDVEQDETFTILEGRATVLIEGGPTLELRPGVMGELKKGDKTTWIVHETLLKTFQITFYDDDNTL